MPSLFIEDLSKPGKAIALNPDSLADNENAPVANGNMLVGIFCDKKTDQSTRTLLAATSIAILSSQSEGSRIVIQAAFGASPRILFLFSLDSKDISEAKLYVGNTVLQLEYK